MHYDHRLNLWAFSEIRLLKYAEIAEKTVRFYNQSKSMYKAYKKPAI